MTTNYACCKNNKIELEALRSARTNRALKAVIDRKVGRNYAADDNRQRYPARWSG